MALAWALVFIASIVSVLAIPSIWAKDQALNSTQWATTSSKLLEDESVRHAVSDFLVDQLLGKGKARGHKIKRDWARKQIFNALGSDEVVALWKEANRQTHKALITVVEEGDDKGLSRDGNLVLNLNQIARKVARKIGVKTSKLPATRFEVEIFTTKEVDTARDIDSTIKNASLILPLAALALYLLAVVLASGRRLIALLGCGISIAVAGAFVLIARDITGDLLTNDITSTDMTEKAANSVWSITTSLLEKDAQKAVYLGLVIVAIAILLIIVFRVRRRATIENI